MAHCRLWANVRIGSDSSHLLLSCTLPLLFSTTGRTSSQVPGRTCRQVSISWFAWQFILITYSMELDPSLSRGRKPSTGIRVSLAGRLRAIPTRTRRCSAWGALRGAPPQPLDPLHEDRYGLISLEALLLASMTLLRAGGGPARRPRARPGRPARDRRRPRAYLRAWRPCRGFHRPMTSPRDRQRPWRGCPAPYGLIAHGRRPARGALLRHSRPATPASAGALLVRLQPRRAMPAAWALAIAYAVPTIEARGRFRVSRAGTGESLSHAGRRPPSPISGRLSSVRQVDGSGFDSGPAT